MTPVIAHLADGPVREAFERYHFGAVFDPPIEIKFAKLPSGGAAKWTRIPDELPDTPWDVTYRLQSIRPIDESDGDEVYAYAMVQS